MRSGLLKNWPLTALGAFLFLLSAVMFYVKSQLTMWTFWNHAFAWPFFYGVPWALVGIGTFISLQSALDARSDRLIYRPELYQAHYRSAWKRARMVERIQTSALWGSVLLMPLALASCPNQRARVVDYAVVTLPLCALIVVWLIAAGPARAFVARKLNCPRCGAPAFRKAGERFCGSCGLQNYAPDDPDKEEPRAA